MDLNELQKTAAVCTDCSLHQGRIVPVFAKGNPEADIMICGMCPGPDENKEINTTGAPFIGRAGKLLDVMLDEVSLTLEHVYITNLVKCFVKPGIQLNEDWIIPCMSYFISQIRFVKPKVIILLGSDVSTFLLNQPKGTSMKKMRASGGYYLTTPVVPTYHPSYFTRGGYTEHEDYGKGIDDFKKAKRIFK